MALINKKLWFTYIMDSGAFTTAVPKLFVEKLKEAGSQVVEVPRDKSVEMRTAVRNDLTVRRSMMHDHRGCSCWDQDFESFGSSRCDERHDLPI